MTQFTASEVRSAIGALEARDMEYEAGMLHAYADRLESDEKVQPTGFVSAGSLLSLQSCRNDEYNGTVDLWMRPNEAAKANVPIYLHPAPADAERRDTMTPRELAKRIERGEKWKLADEPAPCQSQNAERLAEALHEFDAAFHKELADLTRIPEDDRGCINRSFVMERVVGLRRCWDKLSATRAHSAQAQPSAASVPDIETMVNRFLSWRLPKPWNPDNGISYTRPNYAHEPAEHDWPTGTNLFDAHQAREMIEYMLAAQENPNG